MTRRLLGEERVWQYESPRNLVQWYGHVEIHDRHAIGQWFCVDIATGEVLWDHVIAGANSIRQVGGDVIVASETRSGGPWTANFGIFVIDRRTGELLWKSKGVGCLGALFGARQTGTPAALVGSLLYSSGGEVFDVRTGDHVRFVDIDAIPDQDRDESDPAHLLYGQKSITLNSGGSLSVSAGWSGFSATRSGTRSWSYEIEGHHVDGNFFSWRFVGDAILIVVADAPVLVSTGEHTAKENACRYELRVLDVETGRIAQAIPLTTEPGGPCRIEAVDRSHVLVSHGRTLWCYAWHRGGVAGA
jgi:outer membrane protein assembly factor BamB